MRKDDKMEYNVYTMQANDLFVAAMAVWSGYYGNGQGRREKLSLAGYDPEKVQTIVNMLGDVFKKCEELTK